MTDERASEGDAAGPAGPFPLWLRLAPLGAFSLLMLAQLLPPGAVRPLTAAYVLALAPSVRWLSGATTLQYLWPRRLARAAVDVLQIALPFTAGVLIGGGGAWLAVAPLLLGLGLLTASLLEDVRQHNLARDRARGERA